MPIPSEGRVLWPSTTASIPANWSRDTDFDDRYLQGSGTAGTNGGAATHGHTISGSHTHTVNSHTHALGITGAASGSAVADNTTKGFTPAINAHTHGANVPSADYSGYTTTDSSVSVTSLAAHPPYFEFICLKPSDALQDIPTTAVVLSDEFTLEGFTKYSSVDGRFIKIAPAATNGGATGGASTHVHTTAHSHNFTDGVTDPASHTHADSRFASDSGSLGPVATSKGIVLATAGAHHTATAISSVTPTVTDNNLDTNSASNEPAYIYLTPWQNGGSAATPNGVIILFTGTTAPAAWIICDGTNGTPDLTSRQIKCSLTLSGTGGSNTHSHTNPNSTHVSPAHTHTFTNTITSSTSQTLRAGLSAATSTHTHTTVTMSSDAITMAAATVSDTSTDDIRYLYRTCKFITNRLTTVWIKGNTKILGKALIR